MKRLILYSGLLSVSCTFSLLGMQKEIEKFDEEWKRTFNKTSFVGADGMMACKTYHNQRQAVLDKYNRKETDELPKKDVSGIDESVQKQIKELQAWHDKAAEGLGLDGYLILGPGEEFRRRLGKIALESGNLMSNQQKLNHLRGDDWVLARKAIIENMVSCQNIDPNTISYGGNNPLYEAVVYKDLAFTKLLLEKGAKPDKETFKMMRKKPEFDPLMSQYNLTDKKK